MTTTAVAVTFQEMERLAEAIAQSGLFGMKHPSQALALMAIAQAEGQHPALAARDYHIVQGKPVLKSDAMLARFQAVGGRVDWIKLTDEEAEATFSHPAGGSITILWNFERAKRAGLTGKDNWRNYPRQMLRARVISEGIRTVYPGATQGLLTPEEATDTTPPSEVDVTPAKAPALSLADRVKSVAEAQAQAVSMTPAPTGDAEVVTLAEVVATIHNAETADDLNAAVDLARTLPEGEKGIARAEYAKRQKALV